MGTRMEHLKRTSSAILEANQQQQLVPTTDRRQMKRLLHSSFFYPVSFGVEVLLEHPHPRLQQKMQLKIINYHYRGASLQCAPEHVKTLKQFFENENNEISLEFYLGQKCLIENLPARVTWNQLHEGRCFGVEFLAGNEQMRIFVQREDRFFINEKFPVTLVGMDPLDANREIYFKVEELSASGMGLSTSLSNRHLLPGMQLKNFRLTLPGQPSITVEATLKQTRPLGKDSFFLGAQVVGVNDKYREEVEKYLMLFGDPLDEKKWQENHSEETGTMGEMGGMGGLSGKGSNDDSKGSKDSGHKKKKAQAHGKKLKKAVTYKIIDTQAEYIDVLKLRYRAYKKHNKVKANKSWRDQGEGLENEGTILGGYVGGKLVCTVELRYGDRMPFRSQKIFHANNFNKIDISRTVEVNKMAVDTSAQGSDIVVGIFQKIHALSVVSGGLNFLVMSTDKLLRSYLFLGFRPIQYSTQARIQHPEAPSMRLNLLTMKSEVYMNRTGKIHPKVWERVYEQTDIFLQGLGVLPERQDQKSQKYLQQDKKFSSKKISIHDFINPRWTEQHMVATVIIPYILVGDEMIGPQTMDKILGEIGVPRDYFKQQSNWISSCFLDEFLDKFKLHGDITVLNRQAGLRSWDPDCVGPSLYLLQHFFTPRAALKAFEKMVPYINHTRYFRVEEFSHNKIRIKSGATPENILPRHSETCENWLAGIEAYLKLVSGRETPVQKVGCCYHGDSECVYEFILPQKDHKWLVASILVFACIILGIIQRHFAAYFPSEFSSEFTRKFTSDFIFSQVLPLSSFLLLVIYAISTQWQMRGRNRFIKRLEKIEEDTNRRYFELQKAKQLLDQRFEEAKILEETSKLIQASDGLNIILHTTLSTICQKFHFDRAFVMLKDEEGKTLKTVATSGIAANATSTATSNSLQQDLWSFSIDISVQRENPLVLSSVYHTGNPILISDISGHLFQLNEKSQQLIKALGTKGFVAVAIPSENGHFGLIVADLVVAQQELNFSHVTLLQRFAQHVGLALDKMSKMEQEKKLRLYFQKYVPFAIVGSALTASRPTLGGNLRPLVCMFLDIRDFTSLSAKYSPMVVLNLLNRLFGITSEVVTKHGGLIDKYLGDGVLMTWGSLSEIPPHPLQALEAASEILQRLELLNDEFQEEGFPRLRVGMGINQGTAIVGNVGSNERMEFTCIGPTVNMASRLEALCKKYNTSIVMTAEILQQINLHKGQAQGQGQGLWEKYFEVVPNEVIRGVEHPISIAVFRQHLISQVKIAKIK